MPTHRHFPSWRDITQAKTLYPEPLSPRTTTSRRDRGSRIVRRIGRRPRRSSAPSPNVAASLYRYSSITSPTRGSRPATT
ncbi:MAG: hypothetical protein R2856_23150 [Caldilineaceae bacterium]